MPVCILDNAKPELSADPAAFIAPGAYVIGRVVMEVGSSVWFNAVVRGDNELIEIGAGSNVQDGAVLHTDPGFPLVIEKGCTIGHNAILHGCTIGAGTIVGMGAIVMNGATIGARSIVGAGAVVSEGKTFAPGSLVLGIPAKVVRQLSEDEQTAAERAHLRYVEKRELYTRSSMFVVDEPS